MSQVPESSRIKLKRVYEPMSRTDGKRILVVSLWPRGLRKGDTAIEHWYKELAPSTALRQWFGHAPERWREFRKRYKTELARQPQAFAALRSLARKGPMTLLSAEHDELHNNAVILSEQPRCKRSAARASFKAIVKMRGKT